jgi:hypothetical protein
MLLRVAGFSRNGGRIQQDFAIPLFCNLVRTSVYPVDQVFQIEDLLYMKDIESQIADLPEEKIILIANC